MPNEDPDYNDIWVLYFCRCVNNVTHSAVCIHEITPRSKGRQAMSFWNRVPLCAACHDDYTPSITVKQQQLKLKQREAIKFFYGNQKTAALHSGKTIKLPD